jgi:NarL family two-component system response regulator LiaR
LGSIKILIADDHALVRDGTRRILEAEKDLRVVGEASDGEEAVALASSLEPNVAIVDIAMPKLDGVEVTRRIKASCPGTAILVVTAYDDDQLVFGLLEAGAAGYLLKSARGHELVEAVRALHAGESVLDAAITRKVLDHFMASPGKRERQKASETLTQREIEIMKLLTGGLSNQEIADRLFLSIRTVQGHLATIFGKLGVGSRTEAVVRALKEGWVTLEDVPPK